MLLTPSRSCWWIKADEVKTLNIPNEWRLEPLERFPNFALLTSPAPERYMTTIDFQARGLRSGYCTSGPMLGERGGNKRPIYEKRGWKQKLVDAAVAHLRDVMKELPRSSK